MKTAKTVGIRPSDGQTLDRSVRVRRAEKDHQSEPPALSPIRHSLDVAYVLTFVIAVLMAGVSAAGLVLGPAGIYGDPGAAAALTPAIAGVLVPGFLAHDALNLAIGVPIVLGVLWLARRGSLIGLLLWPGTVFYVLYTYTTYVVGAPFSILFLPHLTLVVLSAYTTIAVVATIDRERMRQQLAAVVPARTVGGILVGLALLTLAQDGLGAVVAAFAAAGAAVAPVARHIWTADLAVEVPAILLGGVLLWRRNALGFVVSAGLLFQFGVTPVVLAAMLALQPMLIASPIDVATIIGLLVFAAVAFVPLGFFMRGSVQW